METFPLPLLLIIIVVLMEKEVSVIIITTNNMILWEVLRHYIILIVLFLYFTLIIILILVIIMRMTRLILLPVKDLVSRVTKCSPVLVGRLVLFLLFRRAQLLYQEGVILKETNLLLSYSLHWMPLFPSPSSSLTPDGYESGINVYPTAWIDISKSQAKSTVKIVR